MKKKFFVVIAIIVVLVILLTPVRMNLKDGGSVRYKALSTPNFSNTSSSSIGKVNHAFFTSSSGSALSIHTRNSFILVFHVLSAAL